MLDLMDEDREERSFLSREEGILDCSEDETSQRKGLVSKPTLREVDENPIPLIHCLLDREGRMRLPKDVAKVRIGYEGTDFIQHWLSHRRLHRVAHLVITRFEILTDLGIRNDL